MKSRPTSGAVIAQLGITIWRLRALAAGETGQWTPLGGFVIRGHTDVQVCGWPPAA